MIKVRKENVTYRIYDESKVQEFLNDGFVEVKPVINHKPEPMIINEPTLEELKKEADELGIEYAPNIGAKTLQEKINAYKAGN